MVQTTLIIIGIIFVIFCCCISLLSGGGYYYYYTDLSENITPIPASTTVPASTTRPTSTTPVSTIPTSTTKPVLPSFTLWPATIINRNQTNGVETDEQWANRIYDAMAPVGDRSGGRDFVKGQLAYVQTLDKNKAANFCTNPCYWYKDQTIATGLCGNCTPEALGPYGQSWQGCSSDLSCSAGRKCLGGRCLTKDECNYVNSVDANKSGFVALNCNTTF